MIFINKEVNIIVKKKQTDNPIQKWAKDLNRYFSKEDMQMAKEHMKRYSALLVIREIQIKTTPRPHFIPTKMAIIQKSDEC